MIFKCFAYISISFDPNDVLKLWMDYEGLHWIKIKILNFAKPVVRKQF